MVEAFLSIKTNKAAAHGNKKTSKIKTGYFSLKPYGILEQLLIAHRINLDKTSPSHYNANEKTGPHASNCSFLNSNLDHCIPGPSLINIHVILSCFSCLLFMFC